MTTTDATFKETYDAVLLRRLWVFVRPHRALFFASLLSYPIASAFHLLQPYLVKIAIDDYIVPKRGEGLEVVVLGFVAAIAAEFFARFYQTILTQVLGQRVTKDLRLALFSRLQIVDLAYIERNPVGRLMTRVTNDVEAISEMFSTGAVSVLGDIVTLSGIVIMMIILDPKLTLDAFSVLPVLLGVVLVFRKHAREAFRLVRSHLAKINGFLNEAISGMPLIQIFRRERAEQMEFERINAAYRDANFLAIRFDAMTYAIVEGIGTVAIALLLLLGLGRFEHGAAEIGVFVAFVDYVRRFFAPITELATKYTVVQSALASAERCVELLDQEPSVLAPIAPRPLLPLARGIAFEHVSFAYNAEAQSVLTRVSFTVKRGEKVALVGPTGAGKSTIVKLMARFYEPQEGRVTIDGVDLRDADPGAIRGKMAMVLQDAYLFDGTIRDNVAFGSDRFDEASLDRAAKRTQAYEVIKRQKDGWSAQVGERGARLSSGERQLIAFARALALDPEILVLDEATSAVDPETEAMIQRGLEALIEDRTALIIAHRLSTIRRADRILVLAKGRIAETGTHDELLRTGGLYRDLYNLQFAGDLAQ